MAGCDAGGDSDLCELKGDVAPVSHDLRADLDELGLQSSQGAARAIPRVGSGGGSWRMAFAFS